MSLFAGKAIFLDNEGACKDYGGDGDGISTFGDKFHAGLELLKEVVNGRESGPRCSHAHCIGGKLIVVDLSVS